ncbi:ADP-ribosylation factor 1 [Diplonema papillatum]|nr:ADP-ribosylation factor 1 [Diplonema papillatum]
MGCTGSKGPPQEQAPPPQKAQQPQQKSPRADKTPRGGNGLIIRNGSLDSDGVARSKNGGHERKMSHSLTVKAAPSNLTTPRSPTKSALKKPSSNTLQSPTVKSPVSFSATANETTLHEAEDDPLPHYMIDDMMRSGDWMTQTKSKQGHTGAQMLTKPIITFKVAMIGPAQSGKTRLLYTLINSAYDEPVETTTPRDEVLYVTRGVNRKERINFIVTDLGGSAAMWPKVDETLSEGRHGLVIVVAGQSQEIPAAAEYVKKVLSHPGVKETPFCVLVTKSDLPDCMPLREVEKELGLASLAKDRPYAVASCAIKGTENVISAARGLNELAILMDRDPRISPIPAPAKKKGGRFKAP